MAIITDKPNYSNPANPAHVKGVSDRPKKEGFDPNRVDQIFRLEAQKRQIRANGQGINPHMRAKAPQTAAQEIGWYHDALVPKNEMQSRGLKGNAITGFAEHYIKLRQVNPYMKPKFVADEPAQ